MQRRHNSVDLIAEVRRHIEEHDRGALTERCVGEHRCKVHLDQTSVCLACDSSSLFPDPQATRPDVLIATLGGNAILHWVVVEMTIGSKGATEVVGQLQAGADAVSQSDALRRNSASLIAVVLRRQGKQVASLQKLREPAYRVGVGGRRLPVRVRLCGENLSTVTTCVGLEFRHFIVSR